MSHVDHGYNTRSRGLRPACEPNANGIDNRQQTRNMCVPRKQRPRNPNITDDGPSECKTCYTKYIQIAKIVLVAGILIALVWYTSDRTYNVLRRELDTLSSHICNMESFLKNVATKKGDIENQIIDITNALPQIKDMANTLRDDVQKCKSAKGNDALRNLIRQELELYSADKTGRTDYALETSGGQILNTRNTKSFATAGPSLAIFGIPLCSSSNSPKALIQAGVMPGECWAFKGHTGSAVIKLIKPVYITGVSVEHISRLISPTGDTNTAPKEFSIWGLQCQDDVEGFFFGQFKYDIYGTSVQYFPVLHRSSRTFDIIEFKVHTNHGHPEYTCVYRLRVHGDLKK